MKITKVETIIPDLNLWRPYVWVVIHTDAGITGLGQTPHARTESSILEFSRDYLLGEVTGTITKHWQEIFDYASYHGYAGAESRAISAIDIALWDLLGKSLEAPIVDLLGGTVHTTLPAYNTCLSYNGFSDYNRVYDDPVGLASELKDEGYSFMKIVPFDDLARQTNGQFISAKQIDAALAPVREIADSFEGTFEVAIEAHGLWAAGPAKSIVKALDGLPIRWIEDPLPPDNVNEWSRLRDQSTVPIAGGERLLTRKQIHRMLDAGGLDVLISDITWAGGITETRHIVELADLYGVSFASHGNSGPVNLWAAAHVLSASRNACAAELVRAHMLPDIGYFDSITDVSAVFNHGRVFAPSGPGLGFSLPNNIRAISRNEVSF